MLGVIKRIDKGVKAEAGKTVRRVLGVIGGAASGPLEAAGKSAARTFRGSPVGTLIGEGIEAGAALAAGKNGTGRPSDILPSLKRTAVRTGLLPEKGETTKEQGKRLGVLAAGLHAGVQAVGDEFLYHGTTAGQAKAIAQEGIKADKAVANQGLTSFSDNPRMAGYYGDTLIRVKRSALDLIDAVDDKAYGTVSYFAKGDIPPEAIEVLDGGTWRPLAGQENVYKVGDFTGTADEINAQFDASEEGRYWVEQEKTLMKEMNPKDRP